MPGSHANTAQCLPGHTPFSMLIVPPDSFCAGGREKKKRPPPSLPSLPPLPSITPNPPLSSLSLPAFTHLLPPHRSSFSPPGLRHHWSWQNTHSTGIKVKGCSCLNKERGGEGAEDGGRTGWEGVTHRLSPLFRQRAERGLQRQGGQACDGCLDGPLGVLRRRLFVTISQPVYSLWPAADVNTKRLLTAIYRRGCLAMSLLCVNDDQNAGCAVG